MKGTVVINEGWLEITFTVPLSDMIFDIHCGKNKSIDVFPIFDTYYSNIQLFPPYNQLFSAKKNMNKLFTKFEKFDFLRLLN